MLQFLQEPSPASIAAIKESFVLSSTPLTATTTMAAAATHDVAAAPGNSDDPTMTNTSVVSKTAKKSGSSKLQTDVTSKQTSSSRTNNSL
jgi:hypothetical protein